MIILEIRNYNTKLFSSIIDKFEFLTGEVILPSDSKRVIE